MTDGPQIPLCPHSCVPTVLTSAPMPPELVLFESSRPGCCSLIPGQFLICCLELPQQSQWCGSIQLIHQLLFPLFGSLALSNQDEIESASLYLIEQAIGLCNSCIFEDVLLKQDVVIYLEGQVELE